jgi:hypothetical protein
MIVLPPAIAARIERCIRGEDGPDSKIDEEARTHGAIAVMGAVGMTWGLRPDGSFWMFDADFDVPLEPLPADCETQALVWGARRFPWLAQLLPVRASQALDCASCSGTGFMSATWMCPRCSGLGWIDASGPVHCA